MVRYRMVGRDVNSLPTQYRTWVVDGYPDFTGNFYAGLKSGEHPFVDVTAYRVADGYDGYALDFCLPNPIRWNPVPATMPEAVSNSHFAIIDGYAYLFGGEASDKIFRADINNPCEWVDTEATLPTPLAGAQLAIIDGYIYLFGGINTLAVDTIYSASTSDPLTWTNHGSLLPEELYKSQLAVVDGYVYLFGGRGLSEAKEIIWRASVTDPLTWVDTGTSLPDRLYGSQIAIMDGYAHLLGGLFQEDSPTDNIYSASLDNLLYWGVSGSLPSPCCYGQFLTIGKHGYLFTPAAVSGQQPYLTRIFRCSIDEPRNWIDMVTTLPGDLTQSQFAIIDDRIYSFGGSGMSAFYACDQIIKFKVTDIRAFNYGEITRNQYDAIVDPLDKTLLLGFPYWKTNYGS